MSRISDLTLLAPTFRARLDALLLRLQRSDDPALLMLDVYESARSPARQEELYRRGRGDPDDVDFGRTVTRSRAYQSAHQFGCAVDLVFRRPDGRWTWDDPRGGAWEEMHRHARAEGLEPISREMPHVQIAGFDWRDLPRGPMDTAGWEAWLRSGGAFPTVT